MFLYLSIILMLISIITTLLTRNKPQRLILWAITVTTILQTLSFLFLSGIIQQSLALMYVAIGLVVGSLTGFLSKLKHQGKHIIYQPNRWFILSYLILLLMNQLLAVLLHVYVPIMMYLSAITTGMQLGFNATMLFQGRQFKKTIVLTAISAAVVLLIVFTSNLFSSVMTVQATTNTCVDSYINNYQSWLAGYQDWLATGRSYYLETPEQSLYDDITKQGDVVYSDYLSGKISYDESRAKTDALWKIYYERAWQLTLEREYKTMNENIKRCEQEYNITVGAIPPPDLTNADSLNIKVQIKDNSSTVTTKPVVTTTPSQTTILSTTKAGETTASETPDTTNIAPDDPAQPVNEGEDDINNNGFTSLLFPKPVSPDDAEQAVTISGTIAGLSSMLTTILSLLGIATKMPGIPGIPVPSMPSTPVSPPAAPPAKPAIGSRRDDGKVYTRNHGWQNEDWPQLQTNSIKENIEHLENDMERHLNNGDKLRSEITKDELLRYQRELKTWEEDIVSVKRAQTFEERDRLQATAKRRDDHAEVLKDLAWYGNAVGFATDIALSVGTSGAIPALATAKKTLESLALAKEVAGALTEGHVAGENLSVTITKYGINKGISIGVSKSFEVVGKKYKVDDARNAIKGLVGAGDSSAGSLAQKGAEKIGLTGKIADTVNDADNYFKGKAKAINETLGRRDE